MIENDKFIIKIYIFNKSCWNKLEIDMNKKLDSKKERIL